ncbi:hypothetical protein ACJX0J_022115, partial [Zea mays]
ERLDEVVNFPELKMKISGIKISVIPWLHTTWVVAENVPEELIDMIPEVIEVGNIDAEGASVDVHRPRKFTEENDIGIKYHSGSTSKMIGGMVTSDKTGKLTEVIKEAGEKEGFEGDTWELITSDNILEKILKDLLLISDSIDKMNKCWRVKKRETPELLTLLSGHQLKIAIFNSIIEMHGLIDLDLNNPTFEKLDRFLLEVRRVLIFGKKKEKKEKMEIHSLLNNGRLVDNEDDINKLNEDDRNYLTAPFSLDEIYKALMVSLQSFSRISGILLKRIFGLCVMIFVKEIWTSKDLIMVDNAMEMKNFRPICLLNVIFENIFLIVLLLFMKLFMKFWRQMDNGCAYLQYADDTIFLLQDNLEFIVLQSKEISLEWQALILFGVGANIKSEEKKKSNHYWLNDCCFNNISPPNAANIGLYQKPVGIMLESGVIQNMYGWLASIPLA